VKTIAALLVMTLSNAWGVILFDTGDPSANTTAPTGDLANSGWQYEGYWNGFNGTPIASHFFITAHHIGGNIGDVLSFNNQTFTTTAVFDDPTSDLRIWQVSGTFSIFAPLYPKQDEVGQLVVDIGRGTRRGNEIDLNGNLQGWGWGAADGRQRWGENIVSSIYNNGPEDDLLRATFDQNGIASECTLSAGDSGGGAFMNDGGVWKLAGVNFGVDGHFYTDSSGDGQFDAALIEMGGFWQQNDNPPPNYVQFSGPSAFYPTRISTKLAWIYSVTDPTGDLDSDGIPNLLEYALHLNPIVPDVNGLPQVGREGTFLTLTYTKVTTATDTTYAVEQSNDLVSWTTATTQDEVVFTTGNMQTIKAKVDASSASLLFLRLRVTRP
jgi:hypothetical protein